MITCRLTNNNACATVDTAISNMIAMTVSTPVTPSVVITSSVNAICAGTAVTFSAAPVNGGSAPSYQWKINGVNAGTNSATYTSNTLANDDVVACEMISNAECTSIATVVSNNIKIIVNEAVISSVSISTPDTSVCNGTNVTFTATAVNGGASPLYQWQKNGINVGSNTTSYADNTLKNGDSITCVLKAGINCSATPFVTSNSVIMTVSAELTPAITITASATNICSNTFVDFKAVATNAGTNAEYQWKVNGESYGTSVPVFSTNGLFDGAIITCTLTSHSACATADTVISNMITMTVGTPVAPSVNIVLR